MAASWLAAERLAVQQPGQQHDHRGIQVDDQPLERGGDVLQAGEVEKAREVVAADAQAHHAQPVAARQRRLAPAGPPGHQREDRQREQHAVHEQRHRVDAVAIGQLHDDRLAAEGDRAEHGERESRHQLRIRRLAQWASPCSSVECGTEAGGAGRAMPESARPRGPARRATLATARRRGCAGGAATTRPPGRPPGWPARRCARRSRASRCPARPWPGSSPDPRCNR